MTGSANSSGGGKGGEVKNNKRKKKKNEKWEEAGGEFYQERYPGGQGQAASTADLTLVVEQRVPLNAVAQTRSHFPLPSQTARRNSLAHSGRRGYLTRNARKHAPPHVPSSYEVTTTLNNGTSGRLGNCMTYTSTMGRVISEDADVHISLMPDMADETIPDEKTTYDALLKIKALPEDMTSKRARKTKLGNIPQRRLSGWLRWKWAAQKGYLHLHQIWRHDLPQFRLWGGSLHEIQTNAGSSFSSVFIFLRYTLLLNLLISGVGLALLILPYVANTRLEPQLPECTSPEEDISSSGDVGRPYKVSLNSSWPSEERLSCCTEAYLAQVTNPIPWWTAVFREVSNSSLLFPYFGNYYSAGPHSPPFYGFYFQLPENVLFQKYFAFGYVLLPLIYLFLSLVLMIPSLGQGIKEMIMTSEGEYNSYTNLIFAGWDNGTKDAKSALFKRKILHHEMKISLKNEKRTLEKVLRSRHQQVKLGLIRVLVNATVIGLMAGSGIGIYLTTIQSLEWEDKLLSNETTFNETTGWEWTNYGMSFAPATLITLCHILLPPILAWIGQLEKYSIPTGSGLLLYRSFLLRVTCLGFGAVGLVQLKYCGLRDNATCTECASAPELDGITSRDPCWESVLAYHLYKLLLVDFLVKLFLSLILQPLRSQLRKCCKNKVVKSLGTMRFSIIRHNCDVIYIQFLCWIGIYFAPLLPLAAALQLLVLFYLKKCSLLRYCNQVPDALKTMKTTPTFVAAKLMALSTAIGSNAYVIGYMTPSRGCGPFRKYNFAWEAIARVVNACPELSQAYQSLTSPTITVSVTLALLLLGYYYYSVATINRVMVDTLRHLLVLEGHDKQYLFARLNSLRRTGSVGGGTGVRSRSGHLPSLNHSALPTPPPDPKNT